MALTLALLLALLFGSGCSDGATSGPESDSAGRDGGDRDTVDRDTAARVCDEGRHLCGDQCEPDGPQDPERGCRLGCGSACPAPVPNGAVGGRAICERDGQCGIECPPPSVREGDGCSCVPETCASADMVCGEIDDGCGSTVRCGDCQEGEACVTGACVCAPDEAENNDSVEEPFVLEGMADHPDSTEEYNEFGLGSAADEDWYSVAVEDNFDTPLGGNPNITVTLSRVPTGAQYQLAAWYVCESNSTDCSEGASDREHGFGCVADSEGSSARVKLDAECGGADESGTLLIRVAALSVTAACESYGLHIEVE